MTTIHLHVDRDNAELYRKLVGDRPRIESTADWSLVALEGSQGIPGLVLTIPVFNQGNLLVMMAQMPVSEWLTASAFLAARFPGMGGLPPFCDLKPDEKLILRNRFSDIILQIVPGATVPQALEAADVILRGEPDSATVQGAKVRVTSLLVPPDETS